MSIDDPDDDPSLLGDNPAVERAVRVATSTGMPHASIALYARWWQLETWLRELAYVELRSMYGVEWRNAVKVASGRQEKDAAYTHMVGADVENPLAYLDYSQLVNLIAENWPHFEYALLGRTVWDGRQEELRQIRHRIGHLRRPHADDLNRLDQTLRDLERGTYIALASYNKRSRPTSSAGLDPVYSGWIEENHQTAKRLISHAESQYEIGFEMRASRRPWAAWPDNYAGAKGVLWHCDFFLRRRHIDARRFWYDDQLKPARYYLVHMLADDPHHVGFSFPAVDDAESIADTIGYTFDAVLAASRTGSLPDDAWKSWTRRAQSVDYRLKNSSGWNIVDDQTLPITNFGSGGGVEAAPQW